MMSTVHAPTTSEPGKVAGWAGRTREFFVTVRTELDKVTWPTRGELIKATRMIIMLSLALGVTIGLMDDLLQKILVEGIARIGR